MARGTLAYVALAGLLLAWVVTGRSPAGGDDTPRPAGEPVRSSPRRPVALALADEGKWLFVANRRSGTVSVLDTDSAAVVNEVPVGRKLADLALTADGRLLLAADEEAGELVQLRRRGPRLETPLRVKVSPSPVSVRAAEDGSRCVVASLWPRRLTVLGLSPDREAGPRVLKTIDLEFAPRAQLLLPGSRKLVVADSFGGRLAVVDLDRGAVESDRLLPAHNIRGLALSADGERLLVSHQRLHAHGTTSRDDVHWGNLLTNNLRDLRLASVLAPGGDLLRDSRLHRLGDVGRGAGDPAGVAAGPGGKVAVALAGVGEVTVGGVEAGPWERIPAGRRPTAVVVGPEGRRAYAANTFGDSVSVLDLKANRVTAEVPLGPAAEPDVADRGELLFYDARLSHDGWMSCHSCHTDGHSNGQLADTLGDGSYGTPKRVLTLLGGKDTGPWAWNGRVQKLEVQVRASVETTLQGTRLTAGQEGELVAYLRTLTPPPARGRARGTLNEAAVTRGREVFERRGCGRCHTAPDYTSPRAYDVGTGLEAGDTAFNPPSLRGVSQAGPYFHDGRAPTLAEVFTRYRHQLEAELSREDLADLLTFLDSL